MSNGPTHLLDANLLIALTAPEHQHHALARGWLVQHPNFALCPITEGALMRFVSRMGETAAVAQRVLGVVRALPGAHFVADSVSYLEVNSTQIIGHRQWTDEYLVALARALGLRFATFDSALASRHVDTVELLAER